MKPGKKKPVLIIGSILWVIGLFFLTPIILMINNRTANEIELDSYKDEGNPIIFSFEKITSSQNLFNDVTVSGWAFIEHEGKNPDNRIFLILSSEETSYTFEMNVHDRIDLNTAPILANYAIPKYRNGFEGTFSPLTIKNGTYQLYIHIQESEQVHGIVNTGKEYIKNFGKFIEYAGGEEIRAVKEVLAPDVTVNSHFECNVVNTKVLVNGWAFVDDGTRKQLPGKPIVKLRRSDGQVSYYSTVTVSRVDVANAFNLKSLMLSGFSSEVPSESLGTGENSFSIVFDGLGESSYSCTISWP